MKLNKVLLVGGSGYVGREFQKQLSKLGIAAHSISRINGFDIYNDYSCLKNFGKFEFDCCIFLSPVSGLLETHSQCLSKKITHHLEEIFKTLALICRSNIVFFSSNHVFSGLNGPYDVTAVPDGVSGFSYAKLCSENLCRYYFDRHLVVRTSLLIDEDSSSAFLSWILRSLSNNHKIQVRDDIIASPTLSSNVVTDCINIINSNQEIRLVHLSNGIQTTKFKIAQAFAKKLNLQHELISPEKYNDTYPITPGNYTLVSSYQGETHSSAGQIGKFFQGYL